MTYTFSPQQPKLGFIYIIFILMGGYFIWYFAKMTPLFPYPTSFLHSCTRSYQMGYILSWHDIFSRVKILSRVNIEQLYQLHVENVNWKLYIGKFKPSLCCTLQFLIFVLKAQSLKSRAVYCRVSRRLIAQNKRLTIHTFSDGYHMRDKLFASPPHKTNSFP